MGEDTEGEEGKDKMSAIKGLIKNILRELLSVHQKKDIRELKGKIAFREEYDYKRMRKGSMP